MADKMDMYYFSPTGGTKKVSSIFAAALGRDVVWHNLGSKQTISGKPQGELTVVAAPVFGGRIPSVVREKIKMLDGKGKRAVTIAVYGNRAYDDTLIEMKDIVEAHGFKLVSAASAIAQHSIFPRVAEGRPDAEDIEKLHSFAAKSCDILSQISKMSAVSRLMVNGNRPYRDTKPIPLYPEGSKEQCTS